MYMIPRERYLTIKILGSPSVLVTTTSLLVHDVIKRMGGVLLVSPETRRPFTPCI